MSSLDTMTAIYRSDEEPTQSIDSSSSLFVSSAIEDNFIRLLPDNPRIECMYWSFEHQVLRIWTVIDNPDFDFESQIYDAQLKFMDLYEEVECDFSIIYRLGKPFDALKPAVATQLLPKV
jgi:hypothetical protein